MDIKSCKSRCEYATLEDAKRGIFMKLFLSALCLCASGLLIFVSYKLIYAYTMIDQFHDASLKWIEALKEKDEDLENIQMILSQYEKPIDFTYKVFHKIHSFVK